MVHGMIGSSERTQQQLQGDVRLRDRGSPPVGRSALTRLLRPLLRSSVALAAFIFVPAFSAGLNDTGITFCADAVNNNANCGAVAGDGGSFPRQDARYGRDAQNDVTKFTKIGGGGKGFDYTKIANDGGDRPASASLGGAINDWACTRDNVTGLIWEVKTSSGLRSVNYTYSWYSSNTLSNANFNVDPSLGICETAGTCDTEKYVAAVNFAGLCGATDWRMPTVKELEGLSDFSRLNPAIDTDYFPNTKPSSPYWSGIASAHLPDADSKYYAWVVSTLDGRSNAEYRPNPRFVRLVRGGL